MNVLLKKLRGLTNQRDRVNVIMTLLVYLG